jgi:hypothetical protein
MDRPIVKFAAGFACGFAASALGLCVLTWWTLADRDPHRPIPVDARP